MTPNELQLFFYPLEKHRYQGLLYYEVLDKACQKALDQERNYRITEMALNSFEYLEKTAMLFVCAGCLGAAFRVKPLIGCLPIGVLLIVLTAAKKFKPFFVERDFIRFFPDYLRAIKNKEWKKALHISSNWHFMESLEYKELWQSFQSWIYLNLALKLIGKAVKTDKKDEIKNHLNKASLISKHIYSPSFDYDLIMKNTISLLQTNIVQAYLSFRHKAIIPLVPSQEPTAGAREPF